MNIFWDPAPGAADTYRFALGTDVRELTSPSLVARALADDPTITEVIIGPDVELDRAADLAESARLDRPELGVILLRHRLDVTTLAEALRSGVREVVAADDHTALVDALRRSRELTARISGPHGGSRAAGPEGKVITVFSAKGGVGKTTLSTNLAVHLQRSGHATLLVDLDLSFGDVAISLQMAPTKSVVDAVAMSGNLDKQGLTSLVSTHEPSGLDVISAPSDPGAADRIPAATVSELLRVARTAYEFVVVDTAPSFTEPVLAAVDTSDALVLIATLDIPAVKNLRVVIDTLDMLGAPKEGRIIVLNRADTKVGLKGEDVEAAIQQPIALSIPNSLAVPSSVNRGVPIVLDDPGHPVSVAIRELGDRHLRERFGFTVRADHRTHRSLTFLRGRKS